MQPCVTCGHPTDQHDRDIRFRLPEPVLRHDKEHGAPAEGDRWLGNPDPLRADMLQDQRIGCFLRALLPIHLTEGHTLTYGVWVAVQPDDLRAASSVWNAPEYSDLKITGYLGNIIEPWDVLGTPVHLAVRDLGHIPYCVASEHHELDHILNDTWDHQLVLDAAP